jgi:hypothetical protein
MASAEARPGTGRPVWLPNRPASQPEAATTGTSTMSHDTPGPHSHATFFNHLP